MQTKDIEIRKSVISDDNSIYFMEWKSRKPFLTIMEEIDNQISAKPTFAGISITQLPYNECVFAMYNDGNTPTHERMEKMMNIGKTHSDRNGASLCGVGQIAGLISGRKDPEGVGILEFSSIHNGFKSTFKCIANGVDNTLATENYGPIPTKDHNMVFKTYTGMQYLTDTEIEELKILCAAKIYPYVKENPSFKYIFNGEEIKPIDILYSEITDKRVQHMPMTDFAITCDGRTHTVQVGIVDYARYAKPDGKHMNRDNADALDNFYDMAPASGGVFIETGGVNVINGGKPTWHLLGKDYHTTHNGQRIWIRIPSELKEIIFGESPIKSSVVIPLANIKDSNGHAIFKKMVKEIWKCLNKFRKQRPSITKKGVSFTDKEKKSVLAKVAQNEVVMSALNAIEGAITPHDLDILCTTNVGGLFQLRKYENK